MNSYYIIISNEPKIINTTRNDKKHTPITLYNYVIIDKFIIDNDDIINCVNTSIYHTSYSPMTKLLNNKWCVNLLKITINEDSKSVDIIEMSNDINDKIINRLLHNGKYKEYISNLKNIDINDVFRFTKRNYLIRFSTKHKNIRVTIEYDEEYKPFILLSTVYSVDGIKHHRIFPNVKSTTKYTYRRLMRRDIKYYYSLSPEILYKTFDILLSLITIPNNSEFEIIESHHDYILFGKFLGY